MFRTLIYSSSGACNYSVEVPNWSYCSWFDVCWGFGVVGLEWYPCCRLSGINIYPSSGACEYSIELTHWSYCSWFDVCWSFGVVGLEWYPCCRLTNVLIQQNIRKFLMMDILMPETCWAHKKWNKIASDIKLVFYSSTIFKFFKIFIFSIISLY